MSDRLELDSDRFLADLAGLARVGGHPESGGVTRLAFSPDDRAGRDFVAHLLLEIGLEARIDAIGNLLATTDNGADGVVLVGSHTDTVASGGRYDGALGVMAGVAALRAVVRAGRSTKRAVGLVSFVNEEGVRFMPDMLGSRFVRGDLAVDEIRRLRGIDGESIGEALDRTGMAGADDLGRLTVRAYVELHIEQGPVLFESGTEIGVVTGVQGLRWLRCTLEGASNHAGTTPMAARRDAGYAAARVAVEARSMTQRIPGLRTTVGHVSHSPGLVNVIPGRAECTIDLRHPDPAELDRAREDVCSAIARIADEEGVVSRIEDLAHAAPVTFDEGVIGTIDRVAGSRGYSRRRIVSGAGHDAQIVSAIWPTAMIFVPSRDGVSHSPVEFTTPEACLAGAQVLLDTMIALADAP